MWMKHRDGKEMGGGVVTLGLTQTENNRMYIQLQVMQAELKRHSKQHAKIFAHPQTMHHTHIHKLTHAHTHTHVHTQLSDESGNIFFFEWLGFHQLVQITLAQFHHENNGCL